MYGCKFTRVHPNAIVPRKGHDSDAGFDLSVISLHKRVNNNLALYDTGIQIAPPQGFYAEIHGRSSLPVKGYTLANSVGIVDPEYRGNLFVALLKIDPDAPDIEFPFRCCQLIFRRAEPVCLVEEEVDNDTTRGAGGFGSTDISV